MCIADNPEQYGIVEFKKQSRGDRGNANETYIKQYTYTSSDKYPKDRYVYILYLGATFAKKLEAFCGKKVGFGLFNGDTITIFSKPNGGSSISAKNKQSRERKNVTIPAAMHEEIATYFSRSNDKAVCNWMQTEINGETVFQIFPVANQNNGIVRSA